MEEEQDIIDRWLGKSCLWRYKRRENFYVKIRKMIYKLAPSRFEFKLFGRIYVYRKKLGWARVKTMVWNKDHYELTAIDNLIK